MEDEINGDITQPDPDLEPKSRTKNFEMDPVLQAKTRNFTPLQRRYAECRARGLRQADAALKAGSKANGRGALGRVGYQLEQTDGMKEYIAFLAEKRARSLLVDQAELIHKLRDNYDEAVNLGRIDWANKSLELMGMIIGVLGKSSGVEKITKEHRPDRKNQVSAFTDDESEDKAKAVLNLIKSLNIRDSKK